MTAPEPAPASDAAPAAAPASSQEAATQPARPLRIALIGYSFMGRAHALGWRNAPAFFDPARRPELAVVVGRDAAAAQDFATRWGIPEVATDWREVVAREDIDIVDICTPGDTHEPIALAALSVGKHVLCEKPLANTVEEARRMADAARAAAQQSGAGAMCGFSYRRTPALTLARRMVADGFLGQLWQVRAQYLQDWLSNPSAPWVWRLDREQAGSGALGDIASHIVDAVQWVSGRNIMGVSGLTQTFVDERPLPGGGTAPVTVDDAAVFAARLDGGVLAAFEATRYATGRKNALRVELSGSSGAIAFDLTDSNFLEVFSVADGAGPGGGSSSGGGGGAGFSRIDVTDPSHPYASWWPPGHALGYEHGFTHQAVDFLDAIAEGRTPSPSFDDALRVQKVLAAVERSAANDGGWQNIG